jgi:sarcosine oxidase subunit gamma
MTRFDASLRRSPLEGESPPEGLRELPYLAQLDVRVDPSDVATMSAVAGALSMDLPLQPNTVAGDEHLAVLWLGPDEWLVVGSPGRETELELSLVDALGEPGGSVVDVSANRTTLELRGPRARELLESGCSIDLHPRAFGPGDCAQTLVARANVILWQTAPPPEAVYRLLVRSSFATYMAAWLSDAADADG